MLSYWKYVIHSSLQVFCCCVQMKCNNWRHFVLSKAVTARQRLFNSNQPWMLFDMVCRPAPVLRCHLRWLLRAMVERRTESPSHSVRTAASRTKSVGVFLLAAPVAFPLFRHLAFIEWSFPHVSFSLRFFDLYLCSFFNYLYPFIKAESPILNMNSVISNFQWHLLVRAQMFRYITYNTVLSYIMSFKYIYKL